MNNAITALRDIAQNFNNMSSVATIQQHLFGIVAALEEGESSRETETVESAKLLTQATGALEVETKVKVALEFELGKARDELHKANDLVKVFKSETIDEFKARKKTDAGSR